MREYSGPCETCKERRGWLLVHWRGDVYRRTRKGLEFVESGVTFRAHRRIEQMRFRDHKRRLAYANGTLTEAEWQKILAKQNNRCAYCKREFTDALRPTKDHIVPIIRGGKHTAKNINAACRSCNSRKNGYSPRTVLLKTKHGFRFRRRKRTRVLGVKHFAPASA